MKKCRGIIIPQYKTIKETKLNPLWGKLDQEEFETINVSVEINSVCADCRQILCESDEADKAQRLSKTKEENEIYFKRLKSLTDPYDEPSDVWLEFKSYSTYIKNVVWITDGYVVESYPFYKEEPFEVMMTSGREAEFWMF